MTYLGRPSPGRALGDDAARLGDLAVYLLESELVAERRDRYVGAQSRGFFGIV